MIGNIIGGDKKAIKIINVLQVKKSFLLFEPKIAYFMPIKIAIGQNLSLNIFKQSGKDVHFDHHNLIFDSN